LSTKANIFSENTHNIKNAKGTVDVIFRKSERKKLPTFVSLTIGALAVVGFMSIKNKGKDMLCSTACKMKNMLHKKDKTECPVESCE